MPTSVQRSRLTGAACGRARRQVDIGVVFRLIFGGGAFDEFFGDVCELPMLKQMTSSMERGGAAEDAHMSRETAERLRKEEDIYCKQLAQKLLARLEKCAADGTAAFVAQCRKEGKELCEAPGGVELLGAIGYVYQQQGKQFAGRFMGLEGLFAQIQEKAHVASTGVSVVYEAVRTASMAQQIDGKDGAAARDEEQQVAAQPPGPVAFSPPASRSASSSVSPFPFAQVSCARSPSPPPLQLRLRPFRLLRPRTFAAAAMRRRAAPGRVASSSRPVVTDVTPA